MKRIVQQAVHLPYIHNFPYGTKVFIFGIHGCYHYVREVNVCLLSNSKPVQVRGQSLLLALASIFDLQAKWAGKVVTVWILKNAEEGNFTEESVGLFSAFSAADDHICHISTGWYPNQTWMAYTVAASQVEDFCIWSRQMVLEPRSQLFPITEPVVRLLHSDVLISMIPVFGRGKFGVVFGHF